MAYCFNPVVPRNLIVCQAVQPYVYYCPITLLVSYSYLEPQEKLKYPENLTLSLNQVGYLTKSLFQATYIGFIPDCQMLTEYSRLAFITLYEDDIWCNQQNQKLVVKLDF